MPRTKGGVVARRRRNRVLKAAKGFFGSKHCLFKVANQQVMKGRQYAFRDRKNNKRNFRKLWIAKYGFRMCGVIYLENGDPRDAYHMAKPCTELRAILESEDEDALDG